MNTMRIVLAAIIISPGFAGATAIAAENDHSGHNMHGPVVAQTKSGKSQRLQKLSTMPPSGQAREAGSDGRYVMESTSVEHSLSTKCAQASRGIVMLDNATWRKCGGKPVGASMGSDKDVGQQHQHMHH